MHVLLFTLIVAMLLALVLQTRFYIFKSLYFVLCKLKKVKFPEIIRSFSSLFHCDLCIFSKGGPVFPDENASG